MDKRIAASETHSGSLMRSSGMEVNVISHRRQKYAVWFGGSLLGSLPDFYNATIDSQMYAEHGPSVVRRFNVLGQSG